METVVVKGKVYQTGEIYQDKHGDDCKLIRVDISNGDSPFCVEYFGLTAGVYVDSLQVTRLGTIEDAPIELEDGEWYRVENNCQSITVMFWEDNLWRECESPVDETYARAMFVPIEKMVKA
ncbi:MAG: hypothetical protein COB36_11945 [Alphaproteobacteria bacterium]|nr:MAG: hypothetical protein COB36_11945 [Alphaproteobacteria bacterium]